MTDKRVYIMALLDEYLNKRRKIALLRYELERSDANSAAMEEIARFNLDAKTGILERLLPLENDVKRLEYYVSLLGKRGETVIRRHYFEGCSWSELSAELELSGRTIRTIRNEAVNALIEMYCFANLSD